MAVLDKMASGGRQHRFNTPAWKTDFVCHRFRDETSTDEQGFSDWYGVGNKNAPEDAKLLAGKA
jgi:glycerol 2-dehydrogenase (NADP+)